MNGACYTKMRGMTVQFFEEVKYLEAILDKTRQQQSCRGDDETSKPVPLDISLGCGNTNIYCYH